VNLTSRHRIAARKTDTTSGQRPERGQSLVEFGLVFPIFVTLVMGLIEFAFVFNALLSVNYSARDGSLAAAEAGSLDGADCVIIKSVEAAIGAPAADNRILSIEIYETNPNGGQIGAATVFTRGAPNVSTCAAIDGSTIPYQRTANGYPETTRCNVLGGCNSLIVNDTVDNIGVRVWYHHEWVTPLTNFIGGGAGGLDFDRASVMRMEPIL
jgi:Flp pilus assembly protein TadG